jgi:uncharacterized protein YbjQ (UPF0145 family)
MAEQPGQMCARTTCSLVGRPTADRRCQSCGFGTVAWDAARSEKLQREARSTIERAFRTGIPVSTSNEVPGWEITGYLGEVFGLVVRSRGAFPQLGANLKSVFGGELTAMTKLLRDTRQDAILRLVEEAEHRGADAVIAMRFDVTSMGDSAGWTEICAYGTAVSASRLTSGGHAG